MGHCTAQRRHRSGTAIFVPQAHISAPTAGWGASRERLGSKAPHGHAYQYTGLVPVECSVDMVALRSAIEPQLYQASIRRDERTSRRVLSRLLYPFGRVRRRVAHGAMVHGSSSMSRAVPSRRLRVVIGPWCVIRLAAITSARPIRRVTSCAPSTLVFGTLVPVPCSRPERLNGSQHAGTVVFAARS
jgi:hypothetical protein